MYFRTAKSEILKFEHFIARNLLKYEKEGKKVSQPIVRISIISIALAMIVNLVTLAVVRGFQTEVRDKVIGFGAHAVITKSGENTIFESEPILIDQSFYPLLSKDKRINNIQPVAYKPALLQSKNSENIQDFQQEIEGVLVKGVDKSYNWDFFKSNLVQGKIPTYSNEVTSDEILISKQIAANLNYKLGQEVSTFFVKQKPVRKNFKIVGIYETGYDELDKQLIIADLRHIQQLNDWGIQSAITVDDSVKNGALVIKAETIGGNGNYRYDWGTGYDRFAGFTYLPSKDTVFQVIASDYWMFLDGKGEKTSIPDTATIEIKVRKANKPIVGIDVVDGIVNRKYLDEAGYRFEIQIGDKIATFIKHDGKGSFRNYVGAFECLVHDWAHLEEDITYLKNKVLRGKNMIDLKVSSIIDNQNDIFVWLGFLDINVYIILTLMLLIGIINMGSALLVMILVKTSFVGMMKAMGANDWQVRKVFLYQASYLILRGMFLGNVFGIGLCLIQKYLKPLTLNPKVYYLNAVPIELNMGVIIALNILTLSVCLIAMLLPSYLITKIQPSKSIKFN
jgi:lipoprotein-releasing system permease protein